MPLSFLLTSIRDLLEWGKTKNHMWEEKGDAQKGVFWSSSWNMK